MVLMDVVVYVPFWAAGCRAHHPAGLRKTYIFSVESIARPEPHLMYMDSLEVTKALNWIKSWLVSM
jgi:hypothetical protein